MCLAVQLIDTQSQTLLDSGRFCYGPSACKQLIALSLKAFEMRRTQRMNRDDFKTVTVPLLQGVAIALVNQILSFREWFDIMIFKLLISLTPHSVVVPRFQKRG